MRGGDDPSIPDASDERIPYVQARTMPRDDRLPFHRSNLPAGAGVKLKAARIGAGRSRREIAEAAGVAPRTLARIERGEQLPRWPTLDRLCGALGIDPYLVAPRWSADAYDVPTDPGAVPGLGLRALRRKRGLSMEALSEASGVSVSTFSRFERGLLVSRLLGRRKDQPGVLISERDHVLENDRVASALGCTDSAALRAACLEAAAERGLTAPDEIDDL